MKKVKKHHSDDSDDSSDDDLPGEKKCHGHNHDSKGNSDPSGENGEPAK